MKTLHLNLKNRWFDMIYAGVKKEEYREIKPYWVKRLTQIDYSGPKEACEKLIMGREESRICTSRHGDVMPDFCFPKLYDTITFKNGYAADALEMIVEFKGIQIKEGNPEWGAVPGTKYFVISLGKILSTKNLKG